MIKMEFCNQKLQMFYDYVLKIAEDYYSDKKNAK